MKKFLALMLAFMLPLCALAETYGVSISVETDEILFQNYLANTLMAVPEVASDPNMSLYVRLIQRILDGFALNIAIQEDAVSMDVQLSGGELLDLTVHSDGEAAIMTSSMLEGYALVDGLDDEGTEQALAAELEAIDWTSVENALKEAIDKWLSGLEPVITYGSFVGDAYEGGTKCQTWALSDKHISGLVSEIMSGDLRNAVGLMMKASELDVDKTLASFDELNARVASDDVYRYLLRMVTDDEEKLVGISLTILRKDIQVATVSFGVQKKGFKAVLGLGFDDQNYWCELTGNSRSRGNVTFLDGKCMEWVASKDETFAYAKTANSPVSNMAWYCNLTKSGQRYLWDASLYEGDKADYLYYCSSMGTIIPSKGTIDCSFSIGDSPYIPLTLKIKCGPVEAIAVVDENLQYCSTKNPADAEMYQELSERMSALLLARLMKLLPMDLLLQLNNITLP